MAVEVSVHPLVLLNISDHFTRAMAQSGQITRVVGALVGTVSGRHVQIKNSFEVPFSESPASIDLGFLHDKMELVKQIFTDFAVLGWYSTGKQSEGDIDLHRSIEEVSENPLYLVLNTEVPPSDNLPVEIYETIMNMQEKVATRILRPVPYNIETNDAERLSVDYVSKTGIATGDSEYVENLRSFQSAIRLFKERIIRLLELVEQNESVRKDQRLMRRLNDICNRIPVMPDPNLKHEFSKQTGEELMTAYMSALTKTVAMASSLGEKLELITNTL